MSINANITQSIFRRFYEKILEIPKIINNYNHHINRVDISSYLRYQFTYLQSHKQRNQCPIFYMLLDIYINNIYLLQKRNQNLKDYNLYYKFYTRLIKQLLLYNIQTPAPRNASLYKLVILESRQRYIQDQKRLGRYIQSDTKKDSKRRYLGKISSNIRLDLRPQQVWTGCKQCQVTLYIDRAYQIEYYRSAIARQTVVIEIIEKLNSLRSAKIFGTRSGRERDSRELRGLLEFYLDAGVRQRDIAQALRVSKLSVLDMRLRFNVLVQYLLCIQAFRDARERYIIRRRKG